jgi:hypothetical protein
VRSAIPEVKTLGKYQNEAQEEVRWDKMRTDQRMIGIADSCVQRKTICTQIHATSNLVDFT